MSSTANDGKPWSADDIATAARMWQELIVSKDDGRSRKHDEYRQIGEALKRKPQAVYGRFRKYGPRFVYLERGQSSPVPVAAEMERSRLLAARARQCPLSAIMGDPPPGFSALDMKGDGQ